MTPIKDAVTAIALSGLIIFLLRAIPFLIFINRPVPKCINILEKYVPPVVIFGLIIYCIRNISFSQFSLWAPTIFSLFVTIISFLWKKNTAFSIIAGTVLYMIMIK